MIKRTASQFSRNEVQQIAYKYVTTDSSFTATYFCSLYGFADHVFYSLLARAIVESIVSEEVAWRIASKGRRNSDAKLGKSVGYRSVKRYTDLMERRKLYDFTRKQKEYYTLEYVYSGIMTDVMAFARIHAMSPRMLKNLLKSAIVDDIVSDEIVEMLYLKALRHNDANVTKEYFTKLKAERAENKVKRNSRKQQAKKARDAKKKYAEFFGLDNLPDDFVGFTFDEESVSEEISGIKQKVQQYDYIQMSIADYGITDEEREYLETLEEAKKIKEILMANCDKPFDASNLVDIETQQSFFRSELI